MTQSLLGSTVPASEPTLFDAPPTAPAAGIERAAVLSDDGRYRYVLTRTWNHDLAPCVFIGLNPSTADALNDDPTIRRCIRFARDWGHGGLVMVNLFALRATDPRELLLAEEPIGPDNDHHLRAWCHRSSPSGRVIAAWGAHVLAEARANFIVGDTITAPLHVLGLTAKGSPRHPLYVKAAQRPVNLDQTPAFPTCSTCGYAREPYDLGDGCQTCVLASFAESG